MSTSIYKQTLDVLAAQGKLLADGIATNLVTEPTMKIAPLDWDVLADYSGVVLAWDHKAIEHSPDSTNCRDVRGYPGYFLFIGPPVRHWDDNQEQFETLKQSIRQYYNYQRRMQDVSSADVNEIQCRVLESHPPQPKSFNNDVDGITVVAWYLEPRTA